MTKMKLRSIVPWQGTLVPYFAREGDVGRIGTDCCDLGKSKRTAMQMFGSNLSVSIKSRPSSTTRSSVRKRDAVYLQPYLLPYSSVARCAAIKLYNGMTIAHLLFDRIAFARGRQQSCRDMPDTNVFSMRVFAVADIPGAGDSIGFLGKGGTVPLPAFSSRP